MYPASAAELKTGELRLSGSDPMRHRQCLERLREHAIAADQGGFEGICFSEQHANIEGVTEVSTNPLLLDTFLACNTERLKVGQLGLVLTANHPLRVAEDIATIDQISKGRAFCGFARGNSTRWVNVFSQHFGTEATYSDKGAADEQNLRAVKEAWEIIRKAWTQDTFSHEGEFWTVPARDTQWGFPPTLTLGQGMDEDGTLREVGLVPRLYQKTLPRMFAPLAFRMTTASFWVEQGATAVCFAPDDDFMRTASRVLGEAAERGSLPRRGRPLAPGVFLMLGKTREEAAKLREDYEWLFKTAYSVAPFKVPMGRMLFGTPDDACRQIDEMQKLFPFDEMFVWHNQGLHDEALEKEQMSLFIEKIIPRYS
jgi:alkanesulfonate monooxygenase SsuD/methylene tetrahydromethanopterin reductase-like flavin-dependent oxidoreductase (luciferase family)